MSSIGQIPCFEGRTLTKKMSAEPESVIVLGVTGSIAAYKAADLTSKLTQRGFAVQVIMTDAATKLVQPQTFFTLSKNPVITSLWDTPTWQPEHIALAERCALLVIAPATADIIAKLACGIADDALSTFAISHTGPIIVVPAMNPRMWGNQATQENIATLRRRGITVLEPAVGHVACGESGKGRFPDVPPLVDYISAKMSLLDLRSDKRILVTAGPTREAVDPVRFLTNKSTGKMGFAIAAAAATAGCNVTLIAGPVSLATPLGVTRIDVTTAQDMKNAVIKEMEHADILIMSAAVADYRPAEVADQKIHKSGDMSLPLERTEDVLMAVKEAKKSHQKVFGFAAETQNVAESAKSKLERKSLDGIFANDVSRPDIGFKSDDNEITVYLKSGQEIKLGKSSKGHIATEILRIVLTD